MKFDIERASSHIILANPTSQHACSPNEIRISHNNVACHAELVSASALRKRSSSEKVEGSQLIYANCSIEIT